MDDFPAGVPLEVLGLLRSLFGRTIVEISSHVEEAITETVGYPGRFGGVGIGLALDSGERVDFGVDLSFGHLLVSLGRNAEGVTDPESGDFGEDEYSFVTSRDPEFGDPEIAAFEGAVIEAVDVLVLLRPSGVGALHSREQRALALHCAGRGELLVAVGLDHPADASADFPGVLLNRDVPAHWWAYITRVRVE